MKSWIGIVYFSAVVLELKFSLQRHGPRYWKIRQFHLEDEAKKKTTNSEWKWRNEYTYENYKLINNERYDWKLNL